MDSTVGFSYEVSSILSEISSDSEDSKDSAESIKSELSVSSGTVTYATCQHNHLVIGILLLPLLMLESEHRTANQRLTELVTEVGSTVRSLGQNLLRRLIQPLTNGQNTCRTWASMLLRPTIRRGPSFSSTMAAFIWTWTGLPSIMKR